MACGPPFLGSVVQADGLHPAWLVQAVNAGGSYVGYDSAGMLQPGVTHVYNGSNKPEPVFSDSQWDTLKANVNGHGGSGAAPVYHLYGPDAEQLAAEITRRNAFAGVI